MPIKVLESEYPKPKPWARAVVVSGWVFLSGIAGIDPKKDEVAPDIKSQMELALKRIEESLEAAGTSLKNVVKVTTYITDIKAWSELSKPFYGYFPHPVASTLVGVAALARKEMKIEIDVTAVL